MDSSEKVHDANTGVETSMEVDNNHVENSEQKPNDDELKANLEEKTNLDDLKETLDVKPIPKEIPTYVLHEDIAKTLKCSLCNNFLSFSPVTIISEDGTKFKCGRCLIKTHINIRAVVYENLAKYMKFPCIYTSCNEVLGWKDVKSHEKICEHRTITCIVGNCDEVLLLKNFVQHIKEKHNKYFYSGSLSINNMHNSYGLCVFEHEGGSYLIFYNHDGGRFALTACSLQPHKKQLDVSMSSTGSKYSIAFNGQRIVDFDDRYHCYKCLKGICKSECHLYSFNPKGFMKTMPIKIERDVIRRTFGSKDVISSLNIVDERVEKEEESLDDILLGKETIIDEVNEEDEVEAPIEPEEPDIIKEMMQCPKCKDTMIPPIHECLAGHTLCSECKSKFEKCPVCEGEIDNTRNYVLEEVKIHTYFKHFISLIHFKKMYEVISRFGLKLKWKTFMLFIFYQFF